MVTSRSAAKTARSLRAILLGAALALVAAIPAPPAAAGGLYLPGIGAVSSGRAGASTASADNPEALLLNPAKLADLRGTQVMIGTSFIDYDLSVDRFGTYDPTSQRDLPWAGQDHPTVHDESDPEVGLGSFQLIPMIAVSSDLGATVRGLTVAAGLYAPQSYPSRSMGADYQLDDLVAPPPPTRYDIMEQTATVLVPSIGAAYRLTPQVDVGLRLSAGFGRVTAKTYLWGLPNFAEYTGNEAAFSLDVRDNFIPSGGLGVSYRPTDHWEVAAQFSYELAFEGKGTAKVLLSQNLNILGIPAEITVTPDADARCARGGTQEAYKACADLTLPMNASLGGRYRFFDREGRQRGDVELDLGWENWSGERSSDFRVVVDGQANGVVTLKDGIIRHGFRDTFSARLGGSYSWLLGSALARELVVRGGVGYDTAAAKDGWERADFDGAARTSLAAGASLRTSLVQFDLGLGAVFEGERTVGAPCNPDVLSRGCDGSGSDAPIGERDGADPINPLFEPSAQIENPINHGTYRSRYLMFMLGATAHF